MEDNGSRSVALAQLTELYDEYVAKCEKLEQEKKPFAGVLGLTKGPADDPCHERFAQDVGALLERFRAGEPGSEETRELLRFCYEAPVRHPEPRCAYWMLLAVHALGLDLIERLDAGDAAELYAWYDAAFPRRQRVPVQKKLIERLKKAAAR